MQIAKRPGRVSILHVVVLTLLGVLLAAWVTFTIPNENDLVYRSLIPAEWIAPDWIIFVSNGGVDIYWGFGFNASEFSLRKWPRSRDLDWFERCGLVLPEMRPGIRPNKLAPNQGIRIPFWLPVSLLLIIEFFLIRRRRRMLAPFRSNEPHCDSCGYLLKLNTSGRCPECGSSFDHDEFIQRRNSTRFDRIAAWLDRRGPIASASLALLLVFFMFEPAPGVGMSILDGPKPPATDHQVIDSPIFVNEFDSIDAMARKLVQNFRQSKNENYFDEEVVPQAAGLRAAVREIIEQSWLYRVHRIPYSRIWGPTTDYVTVIHGLLTDKHQSNLPPNAPNAITFQLISDETEIDPTPFARTRYAYVVAIGYSLDLSHVNSRAVEWGGVTDYRKLPDRLQSTRCYGVLLDSADDLPTAFQMCRALELAQAQEQVENKLSRVSCFGPEWERPCPKSIAKKISKE